MQPRGDLLKRRRAGAGRRKFDRQRQSVEPRAHIGDQGRQLVGDLESRAGRTRSSHEQLRRAVGCERRHLPHHLATDPQRLAACRDDPQTTAAPEQILGQGGRGIDDVLAVVEDDDHLAVADHVREELRIGHVEGCGGGRSHCGRISHRRELDDVAAVAERGGHSPGDFQRETRLADTARTDERDESLLRREARELT